MTTDTAPRATTATMALNPNPPALEVAAPGNGARNGAVPLPVDSAVEAAPKRRARHQAGPAAPAPYPAAHEPAAPPSGAAPLTDDELQDLGALQVLAARAGVSVEDYVEDARRLCRSYDRFKAYVAARKAATTAG